MEKSSQVIIPVGFVNGGYQAAMLEPTLQSLALGAMDCRVEKFHDYQNFGCSCNVATVRLSFADNSTVQCSAISIRVAEKKDGHSERRALALAINQAIKDEKPEFKGLPPIHFNENIPDFENADPKTIAALKEKSNIRVFTERSPCQYQEGIQPQETCLDFLTRVLSETNYQIYYVVPQLPIKEAQKYHDSLTLLIAECDKSMGIYVQIKRRELQHYIESGKTDESKKTFNLVLQAEQMKLQYLQRLSRETTQEINQLNQQNKGHDLSLEKLKTKKPEEPETISKFEQYKTNNQKKINQLNEQLQLLNQAVQQINSNILGNKTRMQQLDKEVQRFQKIGGFGKILLEQERLGNLSGAKDTCDRLINTIDEQIAMYDKQNMSEQSAQLKEKKTTVEHKKEQLQQKYDSTPSASASALTGAAKRARSEPSASSSSSSASASFPPSSTSSSSSSSASRSMPSPAQTQPPSGPSPSSSSSSPFFHNPPQGFNFMGENSFNPSLGFRSSANPNSSPPIIGPQTQHSIVLDQVSENDYEKLLAHTQRLSLPVTIKPEQLNANTVQYRLTITGNQDDLGLIQKFKKNSFQERSPSPKQ